MKIFRKLSVSAATRHRRRQRQLRALDGRYFISGVDHVGFYLAGVVLAGLALRRRGSTALRLA